MARPSGGHGAVEIGTSEEVHGRFPPRLHADGHAFLPVHPGHFFVAYNDTVDQYLMRRPEFLFGRPTEAACIDPGNPYILAQQLACAAYELPVGSHDVTTTTAATPSKADGGGRTVATASIRESD